MKVFHDAFVAFYMSERNHRLVNEALESSNAQLMTLHSCGLVMVPLNKIDEFLNSKLHKVRNYLRSRANSIGTPMVMVDSFYDIPVKVDMGNSEFNSYARARDILTSLPTREIADFDPEALEFLTAIHTHTVVNA